MHPERAIWYPFSQQFSSPEPVHIVEGKGALLIDSSGREIIDAISSWWTNIHGHSHPVLAEAAYKQFRQLEHVIFAGFTHSPAEQLAEKLLSLSKGRGKVFFSDNGSTSVEVAIKMAIQYWYNLGRPKRRIIAIEGAYHGDTFGAMSVSERDAFTTPFQSLFFEVEYIPFPGKNPDNAIDELQRLCERKDVAAFIFEPLIQGAAGMRMYSPEILDSLVEIASANDVLCIADEVMTGFYRTGTLFATDQCKHQPDFMCLSKGITGGSMPLSVTLCTDHIYHTFYDSDKTKAFWHGHSYTGNPLACAVANASLELLLQEESLDNIKRIVQRHADFLDVLSGIKEVENPRQTGTIIAWDISVPDKGYFSSVRDVLYDKALREGVLLRPLGNSLYILPPYCITDAQLEKVYETAVTISL